MAAKKAPAPKAEPTPEKVGNVVLAKVNRDLLNKALIAEGFKKKDVEAMALAAAVQTLTTHYEKTNKDKLADCDTCGGASPTSLDACPFCGDDGEAAEEETEAEETDDEEESTAAPAEAAPAAAPAPTAKAAPAAKPAKAAKPVKKDALAKVEEAPLVPEGVTVEKLDSAVSTFIKAKGAGAGAMWDLGLAAKAIYDGQLWKARIAETKAEDGTVTRKNTYKSWNEFCNKELGMTPANAYNLMDVAAAFTREQVVQFGTTKLGLVLKAPEDAQPKLLEAAKTHSKRELQAKVEEASKGKKGKRKTGRKETPKGKGRAKKTFKKNDVLTIAALVDKKFPIPLFKKPAPGQEPTERAEKLEDLPVGWKELENKVNLKFLIKKDSTGKLQASVMFTAIEQDEEEDEEEAEAADEEATPDSE